MKNFLFHADPPGTMAMKIFVVALAAAFVGLFIWQTIVPAHSNTVTVVLGNESFNMRVAATEPAREQGLSDTAPLQKNEGMVFVFDKPDAYVFWMKDMRYAIDIVWIANGRIVDIAPRVPPPENATAVLPRYVPRAAADRVLEVSAGTADRLKLKIGDEVKIVE